MKVINLSSEKINSQTNQNQPVMKQSIILQIQLEDSLLQLCRSADQAIKAFFYRNRYRRYKAEIGVDFINWANGAFLSERGAPTSRLNRRIQLHSALQGEEGWELLNHCPQYRTRITPPQFKRKLWLWCLLNKLEINPGKTTTLKSLSEFHGLKYGGDDKAGGTEWFTIIEPGQPVVTGPYESNKPGF
jgi:hypothetical protein